MTFDARRLCKELIRLSSTRKVRHCSQRIHERVPFAFGGVAAPPLLALLAGLPDDAGCAPFFGGAVFSTSSSRRSDKLNLLVSPELGDFGEAKP